MAYGLEVTCNGLLLVSELFESKLEAQQAGNTYIEETSLYDGVINLVEFDGTVAEVMEEFRGIFDWSENTRLMAILEWKRMMKEGL